LGLSLSDQLELFSEPTDASEKLRQSAERCVAFHTADLSAQERQVLEEGFKKSQFEVCFATSTLAAGVNFPFRTIVFPKLSFQHREPGARLSVSDYRNMSGRAGRLGLHSDGYAVLLPKGPHEFSHAQDLVLPRNEVIESVMLKLSLRRTLLSLVASHIANSVEQIDIFFENTLYWHQVLQKNTSSQAVLKKRSRDAVDWLIANGLAIQVDGELKPTQLGRATAISGLLPETAVSEAKSAGAVSVDAGVVHATADGVIAYAGQFNAPQTTAEVMAIWMPKLGAVGRKILERLVDHKGKPIARVELAASLGLVDGGSFSARLSEVRSTGLLTDISRGYVAANTEALFL
jgi:hypothetical protein